MRPIPALALLAFLAPAACSVENDSANDQMTVQYNQQRLEAAARAARDVGRGVGNVAEGTGRAISHEVGDIDVDVDVTRNRSSEAGNDAAPR